MRSLDGLEEFIKNVDSVVEKAIAILRNELGTVHVESIFALTQLVIFTFCLIVILKFLQNKMGYTLCPKTTFQLC
jgi:hypothetical protein